MRFLDIVVVCQYTLADHGYGYGYGYGLVTKFCIRICQNTDIDVKLGDITCSLTLTP